VKKLKRSVDIMLRYYDKIKNIIWNTNVSIAQFIYAANTGDNEHKTQVNTDRIAGEFASYMQGRIGDNAIEENVHELYNAFAAIHGTPYNLPVIKDIVLKICIKYEDLTPEEEAFTFFKPQVYKLIKNLEFIETLSSVSVGLYYVKDYIYYIYEVVKPTPVKPRIIDKLEIEAIKAFHDAGYNFSNLDVYLIIKKLGIESINEIESIKAVHDAGYNFSNIDVYLIIKKLGIESIKPLQDVGVDFSQINLYSYMIAEIVKALGVESIKPLQELGVDFSKLADYQLSGVMQKLGIESIKPLQDVGVDFSQINSYSYMIAEIVEALGVESIKPLQDVGVDFSKLADYQLSGVMQKLGIESIKPLQEVEANLAVSIDNETAPIDIEDFEINALYAQATDYIGAEVQEREILFAEGV
jgi:biotin operon repressor